MRKAFQTFGAVKSSVDCTTVGVGSA